MRTSTPTSRGDHSQRNDFLFGVATVMLMCVVAVFCIAVLFEQPPGNINPIYLKEDETAWPTQTHPVCKLNMDKACLMPTSTSLPTLTVTGIPSCDRALSGNLCMKETWTPTPFYHPCGIVNAGTPCIMAEEQSTQTPFSIPPCPTKVTDPITKERICLKR